MSVSILLERDDDGRFIDNGSIAPVVAGAGLVMSPE